MDKKNLPFDKVNFILLAVGMAVVILGFILMSGGGSTEQTFNPEVFSTMRIWWLPWYVSWVLCQSSMPLFANQKITTA